jgi:hypothetical protein
VFCQSFLFSCFVSINVLTHVKKLPCLEAFDA